MMAISQALCLSCGSVPEAKNETGSRGHVKGYDLQQSDSTPPCENSSKRHLMTKERPAWPDPWPLGCSPQVAVSATVLPDGGVMDGRIVTSSCPTVDPVVLDWLRAAKFNPIDAGGKCGGQPVEVTIAITVDF